MDNSSRRTVLKVSGLAATGLLAGCLRLDTQESEAAADGQANADGESGADEESDTTTANETDGQDATNNTEESTDGTGEISEAFWEAFDQSEERFQTADEHIQSSVTAAEERQWELCVGEVSAAEDNVAQASEHANEARAIADDEGSEAHQEVTAVWIDAIALQEEQVAEAEAMCQAGIDGDIEAVEQRQESVGQFDAEIEDLREEVQATMDDL